MRANQEDRITRRKFIGVVWGVALVGLFAQAGVALSDFLRSRTPQGEFGGTVVAGDLEEFEPGTISLVQKGRFYIVRLEDGGVLAMWQRWSTFGLFGSMARERKPLQLSVPQLIFQFRGRGDRRTITPRDGPVSRKP